MRDLPPLRPLCLVSRPRAVHCLVPPMLHHLSFYTALPMALGARVKVIVHPDKDGRAWLYPPLSPAATIPVLQRDAPQHGGLGALLSHPVTDSPAVTVHLLRVQGTYFAALPAFNTVRTALLSLLGPAQTAATLAATLASPAPR